MVSDSDVHEIHENRDPNNGNDSRMDVSEKLEKI
jgi:hypothetical protein